MLVKIVSPDQKPVVTQAEIDYQIVDGQIGGKVLINCEGVDTGVRVEHDLGNVRSGVFRQTVGLSKPQHRSRPEAIYYWDIRNLFLNKDGPRIELLRHLKPRYVQVDSIIAHTAEVTVLYKNVAGNVPDVRCIRRGRYGSVGSWSLHYSAT